MRFRPVPRTTTDELLALVLEEIEGLREDLKTLAQSSPKPEYAQPLANTPKRRGRPPKVQE